MTYGNQVSAILTALIVSVAIAAPPAGAAEPPQSLSANVAAANNIATDRQQKLEAAWRDYVDQLGAQERLKAFGSAIASFNEKLAQGADAFTQKSKGTARMHTLLSQHVVDEQDLLKLMRDSVEGHQDSLIAESVALYFEAGIDRETAENFFAHYRFDYAPPAGAFGPLLARARSLSQSDWFRSSAILVGSSVATDAIHRRSEGGGWFDMFTRFLTDAAVSAALDYATDPSARFAKELAPKWSSAKSTLLNGEQGLFPALERMTAWHIAIRNQHLLSSEKGE